MKYGRTKTLYCYPSPRVQIRHPSLLSAHNILAYVPYVLKQTLSTHCPINDNIRTPSWQPYGYLT